MYHCELPLKTAQIHHFCTWSEEEDARLTIWRIQTQPNQKQPVASAEALNIAQHAPTSPSCKQKLATAQHNQFQIRLHERDADLF